MCYFYKERLDTQTWEYNFNIWEMEVGSGVWGQCGYTVRYLSLKTATESKGKITVNTWVEWWWPWNQIRKVSLLLFRSWVTFPSSSPVDGWGWCWTQSCLVQRKALSSVRTLRRWHEAKILERLLSRMLM